MIPTFQWSQHNLQSNYAEVQRKPIPQSYKRVCWKHEEIFFQEKISKVEKIMHLPWILFWLFLFIQEFNKWSMPVGLGTFLEIDLFNDSCLGSPYGVLHRNTARVNSRQLRGFPLPLPPANASITAWPNRTEHTPFLPLMYFILNLLLNIPSPFLSFIFSWIFDKYSVEKNAI